MKHTNHELHNQQAKLRHAVFKSAGQSMKNAWDGD